LFRLVSFIRRLAGRARIFKRGRAKGLLRGRTSLGGSGRAAPRRVRFEDEIDAGPAGQFTMFDSNGSIDHLWV